MNCNMGRRSSGGRQGGLNMLVSKRARVGPDIVMGLIATLWTRSDGRGYGDEQNSASAPEIHGEGVITFEPSTAERHHNINHD